MGSFMGTRATTPGCPPCAPAVMPRIPALPLALPLAFLLAPAATSAQAPRDTIACPAPRSYATCALRVETSFFRGTRVLRGAGGKDVDRIDGFNASRLSRIVAGSDSAAAHANAFRADANAAGVLGIIGGALIGVGLTTSDPDGEFLGGNGGRFVIAGTAISLVGGVFQVRAHRRLARAIWWYNHDVVASP